MVTVGQILKPQGVRGEVKVKALTDDPSRFCVLKSVYACGRQLHIERARVGGRDVYIKFKGIDDRNAAEGLRGAFMEIERDEAVVPSSGEFFISDLIGAELTARGKNGEASAIGVIRAIDSFGAADVFSVECADGGEMTFAFVKALGAEFDGAHKRLSVDGEKLAEVAVYED